MNTAVKSTATKPAPLGPVKGPAKGPVKGLVKAPAKGLIGTPVPGSAKTLIKAPAPALAKSPAKSPAKAPTVRPAGRLPTRVISIASGKGGVGKTSMAVNLAWALGRAGQKVCLLDADLGLANVDILLGIFPEKTLEDVLFNGLPMEEATISVAPNVDVISGSSGVSRMAELSRKDRVRLTREFCKLDKYDYLIIDNSPGITAQIVSICLSSREIIVVVNPEATSITDAYALIKVLRQNGLWWPPMILVNRAKNERQARLIFEKVRATAGKHLRLNCGYLGCVVEDTAVPRAALKQRPLLDFNVKTPADTGIKGVALALETCSSVRRGHVVRPHQFLNQSVMRLLQRSGARQESKPAQVPVPPVTLISSPPPVRPMFSQTIKELDRIAKMVDGTARMADHEKRAVRLGEIREELMGLKERITTGKERAGKRAPEPVPEPASEPAPEPAPMPRKDAALLVCPHKPMREVLADLVEEAGLTAVTASFAGEDDPPDFTGYKLGIVCWDGPGSEVQGLLRGANGARIILVKGYRRGSMEEPAYEDKVAATLSKPFNIKTLFKTITSLAGSVDKTSGGKPF